MKKGSKSLISNLRKITIAPLLLLGICVLVITAGTISKFVTMETRDGLKNLAYALHKICTLTGDGDYALKEGEFFKGEHLLENEIVDNIKAVSGIDATLFWGDTRIVTSILDRDGKRMVGTQASAQVVQSVLKEGMDYFSNDVSVNGVPYFGYYIPLYHSDGSIVGMVFVGKARRLVVKAIFSAVLLTFCVVGIISILAAAVSLSYARKVIFALNKTKEFLGKVAQGDMNCHIDSYLLERTDEIGEMGRFSAILQGSINELVGTDALTGLYNRRSCGILLAKLAREYEDYQNPFVLVMGDIDHFKAVNDKYGHPAGDAVLRSLSALFLEQIGRRGFVARWGGEEFLLVYERMNREQAVECLKALQERIHRTATPYGGYIISITVTFGVAQYTGETSIDEVLKQADDNLYYGKKHGRDCVI